MITVTWAHLSKNYGDIAVTTGIRNILKRITNKQVQFVVFKSLEENIADIKITNKIPNDDIIVYGGGEHLFSHENFKKRIYPIINSNKGIVFPSTFGPFNELDKKIFARIHKHPVSARDEISATIASNILGKEVPSLLDSAFFIPVENPVDDDFIIIAPRLESVGLRLNKKSDKDIVIQKSKAYDEYYKIIKSCQKAKVIIPHTSKDHRLCYELSRKTNCPIYIPNSLDDILDVYKRCSQVISSRFHSLIFGLLFDKEIKEIPWESHGHKIPGLVSMIKKNTIKNLKEKTFDWINDNLKKILEDK